VTVIETAGCMWFQHRVPVDGALSIAQLSPKRLEYPLFKFHISFHLTPMVARKSTLPSPSCYSWVIPISPSLD
jgi:hypothetical protein